MFDLISKINELEMSYLESLWNLLNLRKSILLTEHGQDPFDQLVEEYKELLDESCADVIGANKSFLKEETIFNVLNLIYKLITYRLIPSNNQEEIINVEISLQDMLDEMLSDETQSGSEAESINLTSFNLKDFKLKNVYHIWKLLIGIYLEKKSNY